MGDRGNIIVKHGRFDGIAIYSHWGGNRLADTVCRFVASTTRNDPDYFTRNLLCRVIADGISDDAGERRGFDLPDDADANAALRKAFADELSFGIGLTLGGPEYPVIVIDPAEQTVTVLRDEDSNVITAGEAVARSYGEPALSFAEVAELTAGGFVTWDQFVAAIRTGGAA